MTTHLTDDERLDALEGTLEAARRAHLHDCAACRQEIAALQQVLDGLVVDARTEVPEPPPVFWDQLQARVSSAVDTRTEAWWTGARGWMSLAAAAVLLLVVSWGAQQRTPVADLVVSQADVVVETEAIGDTAQWQFVSDVLASLEDDAVHEVLRPAIGAFDDALATLSASEREEFARLLQAELTEGSE